MLTPIEIQQKRFKTGLGFEKKDVLTFFEEVANSYDELYRSNASLKEKVITLTDNLQHYKTTEESLKKNLLLAEKASQDTKSNANREAKNIELEAKNRANEIVSQAFNDLEVMEARMKELETKYAEYKHNFAVLLKQQFELLEVNDFHPDAYIDPDYAGGPVFSGGGGGYSDSSDMGGFGGDPQMRDGSSLGGGGGLGSREDRRSSTSNVYGSVLGGKGIDPFGENSSSSSKPKSTKSKSTKTTLRKDDDSSSGTPKGGVDSSVDNNINIKKTDINNSNDLNKHTEATAASSTSEAIKNDEVKASESSSSSENIMDKIAEALKNKSTNSNNESSEIAGDIQDKQKVNNIRIGENDDSSEDEDDDGFVFI